jgi:hypothetical protein
MSSRPITASALRRFKGAPPPNEPTHPDDEEE